MSIELYKKYRPTRFSSLIGQQKVADSLKNAIKSNKIPTGFLFSGPRGCGKTSAALILAKALNCDNLDNEQNPCNKCETCKNINTNTQMGVNYISMANKGTTEDIRELVKQARLHQPVKKQVFILDEVHNIHRNAFDALLIPLEEDDMPAVFILCTTEIDKIPQTIKSRVSPRKFTLVSANEMETYLQKVIQHAKIEVTQEQIQSVIRAGRGSVRDTLTALDSVQMMGNEDTSYGVKLVNHLSKNNLPGVLQTIAEADHDSVNFRDFAEQLFGDMRDLMLSHTGANEDLIGVMPFEEPESIIQGLEGLNGLSIIMDEIGDCLTQMSQGSDARIRLEFALLKSLARIKKLKAYKQKNN